MQRRLDIEGSTLAERVRSARMRRGWSQLDLAKNASVAHMTVSSIENEAHKTRPSSLRKVARALGVEVNDLYPPVKDSGPKVRAARRAA